MKLEDLKDIDTHGLPVREDDSEIVVDLPLATVSIHKRNWYCDRGRYGFRVDSRDQTKFSIDGADGFPRYFFNLQRAFDELNDWAVFRAQKENS